MYSDKIILGIYEIWHVDILWPDVQEMKTFA